MKKKNLKFALTCIIAVAIVSCKKEKTETPSPTNNIPIPASLNGTWTWIKLYGCVDGNTAPAEVDSISMSGAQNKQLTFVGSGTYSSDWSFAQMGSPPATNADNGVFTTGDSLIMTSNITGKMCRGKVYKLTANALWYRYSIYNGSVYEVRFVR